MAKIGILIGSFNPIHKGHLAIAEAALKVNHDEAWLVVLQKNSYQPKEHLASHDDRVTMTQLATEVNPRFKVLEGSVDMLSTLGELHKKYPEHQFSLLMGQDLVNSLPQWPDGQQVLENYQIYCYPRSTYSDSIEFNHPSIRHLETARVDVSSGIVRDQLKKNEPINDMVPAAVAEYIKERGLYR